MSLSFESVSFNIGTRAILTNVSLNIECGETLSLVGPNGGGKTHLLKLGLGLLPPSGGRISLDSEVLNTIPPKLRARYLGYIPQSPHFDWPLPVRDVVALGLYASPELDNRAAAARVAQTLGLCQITHLAERPITQLSGGEQARVSAARALVSQPKILVADEPFAHCDLYHKRALANVFLDAQKAWGMGILQSVHDLNMIGVVGGQYLALKSGRVFGKGPAEALTHSTLVDELYDPSYNLTVSIPHLPSP